MNASNFGTTELKQARISNYDNANENESMIRQGLWFGHRSCNTLQTEPDCPKRLLSTHVLYANISLVKVQYAVKQDTTKVLMTAHNLQFLVGNQYQAVINTNIIQRGKMELFSNHVNSAVGID